MNGTHCFLDMHRVCEPSCMAFSESNESDPCRLLKLGERFLKIIKPVSSRPVDPAPKVK